MLKIKNKYLIGLANWLNEQDLPGKLSRERNRFVETLSEAFQEVEKERMKLIEKHSKKDENEKPIIKDNRYELKNDEEFNKEFLELMDDEFLLDMTPVNQLRIKMMKNIILETDYKFGPKETDSDQEKIAKIRQMQDYDKWCEAFETI